MVSRDKGQHDGAAQPVAYLEQSHVSFRSRIARTASRPRLDLSLLILDAVLCAASYLGMMVLRFDGAVPGTWWNDFGLYVAAVVVVHIASNLAWGLYRQMWRHASVIEARSVLASGATALAVAAPIYFGMGRPVPLTVALLGSVMATFLMGALRFQSRLFATQRTSETRGGLRTVVVGAGEAGAAIVREMQRDPTDELKPVALIDDDPRKLGLSMFGVKVIGAVSGLAATLSGTDAQRVILAIPSAGPEVVARVARAAEQAKVPLKIAPKLGDQLRSRVSLRDVRDLRIEDLVGRHQVETDLDAVRHLLEGRRVLVTGGGGSIGSEIARQCVRCDPERLVLLDNDETHLYDTAADLEGEPLIELADVRDRSRVDAVFAAHRPEIVFHAAAVKHVPMLEQHPHEALVTNVLGTMNVVEAARKADTQRLVFISTDKAVRPTSVMGATKWLGEQIVLANAPSGTQYCAVRFGNVLGSRGSVVPTFARQIAAGGPVTVTHPDMTRYFMSIEEAVQLVLQAAVFADGREVFMLDMGEPMRIVDLAERMIRLAGHGHDEIPIEIVGRRPGEKLTEDLQAPEETCSPTHHESIVRLYPRPLDSEIVRAVISCVETASPRSGDAAEARMVLDLANGGLDLVNGGLDLVNGGLDLVNGGLDLVDGEPGGGSAQVLDLTNGDRAPGTNGVAHQEGSVRGAN